MAQCRVGARQIRPAYILCIAQEIQRDCAPSLSIPMLQRSSVCLRLIEDGGGGGGGLLRRDFREYNHVPTMHIQPKNRDRSHQRPAAISGSAMFAPSLGTQWNKLRWGHSPGVESHLHSLFLKCSRNLGRSDTRKLHVNISREHHYSNY